MFHATHVSLGRVRVLRKVRISWKTVNAWKLTWKVRSWESKKLVTTSFAITAGSFSRHEYYLLVVHCISITYARIPIERETFDIFALSFFFLLMTFPHPLHISQEPFIDTTARKCVWYHPFRYSNLTSVYVSFIRLLQRYWLLVINSCHDYDNKTKENIWVTRKKDKSI